MIAEGVGTDAKSWKEIIDELEEIGYKAVRYPKTSGFIFPDGTIVEIGDDDHTVVSRKAQRRFGIHSYRITTSTKELFIRIEGDLTPQQVKAFEKFNVRLPFLKAVYIDIEDKYSFEFGKGEVDDLGYLVDQLYHNPKMYKRMSMDSYEEYVKRILEEYLRQVGLFEANDKECAKKYAVLDANGRVLHFKGPPGKGVRFKNCVRFFMDCKGLTQKQAEKMCAEIARKKCQAGKKWACGRRK